MNEHKQQPKQEQVEFSQFLSDVMTAAGLVGHGKQCKALADRLGEGAMRYLTEPPKKEWVRLTDEQVEKIIKSNMSLQINLAGIRADFEAAHGIKENT